MRAGADVGWRLVLTGPGFIVLAHERLDRAAGLARTLARTGPVVVHVDAKAGAAKMPDLPEPVQVVSTRRCHWGMMGLVDATLDGARLLLEQHHVSHVCLLSGSCLPIRPPDELAAYLERHPDTDFIESFCPASSSWVQGGLAGERFTLYFPVGWKSHRRVFDSLVDLQRSWRIRRRVPDGLEPRLGLQWWCLTRETLTRILGHPRLPEWRRWFRWTWIPDESFFQTLVPHVATGSVRCESLTLQHFDEAGRPLVFHDDHAALLEGSRHFFARKIDPDASGLYARLLGQSCPSGLNTPHAQDAAGRTGAHGSQPAPALSRAKTRDLAVSPAGPGSGFAPESKCELEPRCAPFEPVQFGKTQTLPEAFRWNDTGRDHGLLSQSRMPAGTSATHAETARPYLVFVSTDGGLLEAIHTSYTGRNIRFHGRLFGPAPAQLASDPGTDGMLDPGCLPTDPVQRDYRPAQYLARLIWAGRDRPSAFLFDPADNPFIRAQILADPNARIVLIGDAPDLAARLREPPGNRRGQPIAAADCRAWFRAVCPQESDPLRQVRCILDADLREPAGWTLPHGTGYPP